MDFNADLGLRKIIDELSNPNYKPNKIEYVSWKKTTEQIIKDKGLKETVDMVLVCGADVNNKDFLEEYYPKEIFKEEAKPIKVYGKSKAEDLIKGNLKIIEIAKRYGLKVKGNKAVCPFHDDNDPSLSLDNKKNVFFCHGCHTKGDIITFIKKLEGINGRKE